MDAFSKVLKEYDLQKSDCLCRCELTTLQVNMGNLCNQSCLHCHVEASPQGEKIMSQKVVEDILSFLSRDKINTLDITGGAPEMNPHLKYLLTKARPLVEEIIVRTNLTILQEKGYEAFLSAYKDLNIHLVCSLPCYLEKNVDSQRGEYVFKKSVHVLQKLNQLGFARQAGLNLDLVYNPVGTSLPPGQEALEKEYKSILNKDYGIDFNRLITITNVPIKRFKRFLQSEGQYDHYCELLRDNFNPDVLRGIMCRSFLSVGYDGKLYDCDFNQALGLALKDKEGSFLTIGQLKADSLKGREILMGEHCLSCTAGSGSSCQGALDLQKAEQVFSQTTREQVRQYYGETLKTKKDLKTSACCSAEEMTREKREILKMIEPEVLEKFYGCGSPVPPCLENCRVLDLGSGTGRDVFLASYLVGEKGYVLGVDMTDEQLAVAQKYVNIQAQKFGYAKPNTEFRKGYIEDLKTAGIQDSSQDVVISNCVVNLSSDKRAVFSEIFRVLKEGGELYFSDVFADRRVPEYIKNDPVFYGECLGGALYIEDFRRILRDVGFPDYGVVSSRVLSLDNDEMKRIAGSIRFYSMTIRAFKLSSLEDICEDYGQVAVYQGTVKDFPHSFILDDHHEFITDKPMLVCGNTSAILSETRYASHFKVMGNRNIHFGSFDCKSSLEAQSKKDSLEEQGGSCC